mgnify:FL=1
MINLTKHKKFNCWDPSNKILGISMFSQNDKSDEESQLKLEVGNIAGNKYRR